MHWLKGQLKLKRYIPHDSSHLFLSLHKKETLQDIELQTSKILRVCQEYAQG